MNARVVVAEANNPGTGANPAQRVIRVVKPQHDQAVSIRLEGDVRLDLSDIGTEKLIFVRVGDRLVILFDNQSAVGIEGAFDGNGQPSPDLSFLVDGNHIVSGTDFAAMFPVTTDPSILPAAGNAAGGPTSAASFRDASVDGDGFGGRIALDLVAGEDGGDRTVTGENARVIARPAVNDAPVARNDAFATNEDTPKTGNVLADNGNGADTGVDASNLRVVAGTFATLHGGTVVVQANGDFTYTPPANHNGPDSFTYTLTDGTLTDTATVSIAVNPVNDAPVAANDAYQVNEDGILSPAAAGVLANDGDIDGNPLSAVLVAGPAHGTLTLNADGSFVYTPTADYHGADSFTYHANDGSADSNVVTVNLTVNPVNDAPVLNAITPPESVPEAGNAAAQDIARIAGHLSVSDVDVGDTLTASVSGAPVLAWSGGALSEDQIAALTSALVTGKLSFDGTVTATGAAQSIGWSWDPAAADLDFLADGQTLTVTYSVQVSDGTVATAGQPLTFTITGSNDAPVITSNGGGDAASMSVAENQTAVTQVASADPDGPTPVYAITGGADAALFAIDSATGELKFIAAPDFETPADADGDNVYDVQVKVSDGDKTDIQDIAVTVTDVNEAPSMTSSAAVSVVENSTSVMTVTSTDPDAGAAKTYTIVGGADAALFSLDAATGELKFIAPPNFETPADAGGKNVYDVKVQVSDGTLTATQDIAVTVTDVNEAPVITSAPTVGVTENQTAVLTVASSDPDANATRIFTITGGADAALFTIDSATGELKFIAPPNFEAPADAGGNNVYDVKVQVSDGALTAVQDIAVTVSNVNEAPSITSAATVSVTENQTAVLTVASTDPDANATRIFTIVGGADAALFSLDAATGELKFIDPPNFETPADAGGNNVYDVKVQVSDGALTAVQDIAVTVGNVNEAPVITSAATVGVAENQTAVLTLASSDPDAHATATWTITGGADAALFSLDQATGQLKFIHAPNFEAPADAGGDNVYDVQVQVSDGALTATQDIAVTVTDVNEAPVITSSAAVAIGQHTTAVMTVTAFDPDAGATSTWSIAGGADAHLFTIDQTTGALAFIHAPDFHAPADAGGDNVYDVQVRVSDGMASDTQSIAITVQANSDPVAVNDTISWITNADTDLDIVFSDFSGRWRAALNNGSGTFTTQGARYDDSGNDMVLADIDHDGDLDAVISDTGRGVLIQMGNGDGTFVANSSAPIANTAGWSIAAGDLDGDGDIDFVVSGSSFAASGGTNKVLLNNGDGSFAVSTFGSGVGLVSDVALGDLDGDGDLDAFVVQGEDGTGASVWLNNGDGTFTVSGSLALPGTAVALADFNGDGKLDAYVGTGSDEIGADHILYGNGDGTFYSDVSVPGLYSSHVATGDLNGDGRIDVVAASFLGFDIMLNDGAGGFTTTSFALEPVFAYGVTLGDVNGDGRLDIVLATSSGAAILINDGSGAFTMPAPTVGIDRGVGSPVALGNLDNTSRLYANVRQNLDVLANDTDADGDALTITGVGTGGIGASIGVAADGRSVVYDASGSATATALGAGQSVNDTFTYTISDGHGGTSSATVTVKVTGVNDAPEITSGTTATEAENTPAGDIVYHVAASDADANAVLTYSLGGADRARFTIDSLGNVKFVAAPDFEAPVDANSDNDYQITVKVSDGTVTTSKDVTISVTNVNEAPQIASAPVLTVSEGGWTILTAAAGFTATDDGNSPVTLNTFATSHGAFQLLTGNTWSDVSSFTTADVDAGRVRFLHDGSEAAPGFVLSASDGSLNSQAVQGQVVFTNVNDAPTIGSPVLTVSEGGWTILTAAAGFTASDSDSSTVTLNTFATTSGAFQLLADGVWSNVTSFTTADVDAGHVRFLHDGGEQAPSFIIQASDGALASAAVDGQVVFTHVNDAPIITSNGGGDAAAISVAENQVAVTTVTSADPDSATRTYAISGGADAALFTIDGSTGELKFIHAPDFETPADAGADNVYDVQVKVSDGDKADIQDIAVTVTDANEAPSITSASTVSVAENQTAAMTVTSIDPDAGATASYAIVGGADASRFTIDQVTGVLKFVTAPNFEVPADAGGNNVYDVKVQVGDGALTGTRDIAVTVTDVFEAPGSNHAPQLLTGSEVIAKTSAQLINTIDVALDLDGHFRTGADPDIANATTVPHVSIEAIGGGQNDFYAFTVTQAGTATFDIDHTSVAPFFDSYLRLFNAAGQVIAAND
ncbi:MAG: hypothetical protein JWQ17_1968, partial [Tardiphaga sp.]|nr:hypothetical protein [Tardiphaga sp.]